MGGIEIIKTLYAYSDELNERFLNMAENLTEEQLNESGGYSHGSLSSLLAHLLFTEWVWRELAQNPDKPEMPPRERRAYRVAELRAVQQAEQARRKAFLDGLSEAALAGEAQVFDPRTGKAEPMVRWHMLMQPLVHSVQHRSEAAQLFTQFGQSPGNIDFIFFAYK
jgi:uncharacterized damage-inducible protein DinB